MAVIHVTNDTFEEEVLNSSTPVLVDFWAPWCGPCQMMGPVIDELSEEIMDVKFAKVNTDKNPEIAQKYRVASIPLLLFFKDGEIAGKSIGAVPKSEVKKLIGKA